MSSGTARCAFRLETGKVVLDLSGTLGEAVDPPAEDVELVAELGLDHWGGLAALSRRCRAGHNGAYDSDATPRVSG
ncbi:hypothetical protein [Mycolicibacterium lutetiense]|uniref:Uncharacterized protein n=1 Tax=Mycolicibacterium lutetiense TaxID=1641992 RepID=A0ABS4ZVE5_9MYCO|nr:hypothetical protein [Mycolicibacterium lutetiense]MBP2453478.1 hypothetical protein [Mycolicibacterium lutetiense]